MAKSKKNLLAAFAILGALLGGGCVPPLVQNQTQIEQPAKAPEGPAGSKQDQTQPEKPTNKTEGSTGSKTVHSEFGYSFTYPAMYVLNARIFSGEEAKRDYLDKGFDAPQEGYFLIQESEVRPEGFIGEGPPSIDITYWANERKLSLSEWAKKNSAYTGFHDGLPKYTEETIQGNKAIRYTSDGLYTSQDILIEYKGGVLAITAAYFDESHPNLETLDIILKNLEFHK